MSVKIVNNFFEFYIFRADVDTPTVQKPTVSYDPQDPEAGLAITPQTWFAEAPALGTNQKLWVIFARKPVSTTQVIIAPGDWSEPVEYRFVNFARTVDETVPQPFQDNPSEGLRSNFAITQESLDISAQEIEFLNLRVDYVTGVLLDGGEEAAFIPADEKGANGGVATLDSTGNVPATQLENYTELDFKTINGDSIFGVGDIEIVTDAPDVAPTLTFTNDVSGSIDTSLSAAQPLTVNSITTSQIENLGTPGSMSIWRGTQSQYNNLSSYSPNILYIIIP